MIWNSKCSYFSSCKGEIMSWGSKSCWTLLHIELLYTVHFQMLQPNSLVCHCSANMQHAAVQSEHWHVNPHIFKLISRRHLTYTHTEWAALSWMNFIMSFLGKSSLLSCSSLHSRVGSAAILRGELMNFDPRGAYETQHRLFCFMTMTLYYVFVMFLKKCQVIFFFISLCILRKIYVLAEKAIKHRAQSMLNKICTNYTIIQYNYSNLQC